jgi:uncharacterized damage-inducible protein DinB
MAGRPHSERLLADLTEIRQELVELVEEIPPTEMDWAPADGMKSYKALLEEIGAMEALTIGWIVSRKLATWQDAVDALAIDNPQSAVAALEKVRSQTKQHLSTVTEEDLEKPIPTHESWSIYFGPKIEPEELIRWIIRHEYYHLGQMISYRWIQGHNPYSQS